MEESAEMLNCRGVKMIIEAAKREKTVSATTRGECVTIAKRSLRSYIDNYLLPFVALGWRVSR